MFLGAAGRAPPRRPSRRRGESRAGGRGGYPRDRGAGTTTSSFGNRNICPSEIQSPYGIGIGNKKKQIIITDT